MENFVFQNRTKIIFGRGTEERAGAESAAYGKKVLLHYGGGSITRSGLYDRLMRSLAGAGLEVVELGGARPNPRLGLIREGIRLCRDRGVEFILAAGGGSAIDSAKAIAAGVPYRGDVWDFACGRAAVASALPLGAVLTIPAAGSESSRFAVITNEQGWYKRAIASGHIIPRFAIMNPELTVTLPPYQSACGVVDIMAHAMERYFTRVRNVELTDRLCEGLLRTVIHNGPKVMRDPRDYDARAEIMWAGSLAHNDLLGTGRIGDFGSHKVEHELSAAYDLTHGAGLSIIFPAWMRYVWRHDVPRFVQFAGRVWEVSPDAGSDEAIIMEGIARMERFFAEELHLPVRLNQAGITADRFDEMARKCTADDTAPVGAFVKLHADDVRAIYDLAAK